MLQKTISVVACLILTSSLHAQNEEFGEWISLFNGKDTTGWTNARGQGPNRWVVAEGILSNAGGGINNTCTEQLFDNYELELEYRVPRGGNSGVYLRGVIEVQVLDNRGKADSDVGTHDGGAIYGHVRPLANPQKPVGQWNTFRIRHIGDRITVWHNGVLVQDNVHFDGRTGGAMGRHPSSDEELDGTRGPIMLQGDHSEVSYRNLRIRPLCSKSAGWQPIFDGTDLSAFRTANEQIDIEKHWAVKDHVLTNEGHTGHSDGRDIWTKEPYGNFLVHYEYRVNPEVEGGNGGFYLRDQWEIQIYGKEDMKSNTADGDLYSKRRKTQLARHEPRQWNHMDVKVDGMKIWVWQNGTLIHDAVTLDTRTDNHGVKTETWSKAPFKLQGDHGEVYFANIYIKPLRDGADL